MKSTTLELPVVNKWEDDWDLSQTDHHKKLNLAKKLNELGVDTPESPDRNFV